MKELMVRFRALNEIKERLIQLKKQTQLDCNEMEREASYQKDMEMLPSYKSIVKSSFKCMIKYKMDNLHTEKEQKKYPSVEKQKGES